MMPSSSSVKLAPSGAGATYSAAPSQFEYNYSMSVDHISEDTLLRHLETEFGDDFYVKLRNDRFYLNVPRQITVSRMLTSRASRC